MTDPNLIIATISLIVSIIALYFTYYFFNYSLREKKPLFTIESQQYQGDLIATTPDSKVVYQNDLIKKFTVSRVAIWNDGKDTIFKKDISQNDKITIAPESGYQIYFARLLFTINNSNNCKVKFSNGNANVSFDYLDYLEGCSVEVFHSGKTSWSINVTGSIIGAGKIIHAKHIPYPQRRKLSIWISISIFIVSVFTSLLFGLKNYAIIITINGLIAMIAYAFLPGIISFRYFKSKETSLLLGVADDDESLRAPDFPPTGRMRERDKDANPYW